MPRKVKQDDTAIRKKKKNKKQTLETFGKYTTKHVRFVENFFFKGKKKRCLIKKWRKKIQIL